VTNASDVILDSDGDGAMNATEYAAGTDPHNAQDYLRLEYVRANDLLLWTVRFLAVSNRTYKLQARGGFSPGAIWRPAEDVVAAPTNRIVEINQPAEFNNQQFFRVVTPRSR